MALVVGSNSYVTVAEADAYFAERYGSDSWAILTTANKEAALINATNLLDSYCTWEDDKTDPEQILEFPRDEETTVPQAIKNAQCEIALAVVAAGGPAATPSNALSELTAGSATLKWNVNPFRINQYYNSYVKSFLNPYCVVGTISGGCSIKNVRV